MSHMCVCLVFGLFDTLIQNDATTCTCRHAAVQYSLTAGKEVDLRRCSFKEHGGNARGPETMGSALMYTFA